MSYQQWDTIISMNEHSVSFTCYNNDLAVSIWKNAILKYKYNIVKNSLFAMKISDELNHSMCWLLFSS